jgi:3-carboxy-cis,cis-muconate cycloisomerase
MNLGIDAGVFGPGWVGAAVELDDRAWVQAMLAAEVALATAQERVGMMPASSLSAIRAAAQLDELDLAALAVGVRETANPVVALVEQLTARVAVHNADAADDVHRGGTSQDVLDSAMMLLCARTLDVVAADLDRTVAALAGLAATHRDTVMVARTLTQHAVPTTFGLKAAGWLTLAAEAAVRVRMVRAALPASLGGAAGTLAAYEQYAMLAGLPEGTSLRLAAEFAAELGLVDPVLPWHALRTPIADVASALTFTAGALGKLAADVLVLTRTEIREVVEPGPPGRGASSAMPQKRNPVLATLIASAARQLPAQALVLYQSMAVEDERSAGGWHAEWQPLRECLRLAAGAAATAAELASELRVRPDRMASNLAMTGGAVVSERVTAVLAPGLGKAAAKRLLTAAVAEAETTGDDLADVLAKTLAGTAAELTEADLRQLLDPAMYTGVAGLLVDRALATHRPHQIPPRAPSPPDGL